jgi:hypothetical protein
MECSQSKTINAQNAVAMSSRAWTNKNRKRIETDQRAEYVSCLEVSPGTRATGLECEISMDRHEAKIVHENPEQGFDCQDTKGWRQLR